MNKEERRKEIVNFGVDFIHFWLDNMEYTLAEALMKFNETLSSPTRTTGNKS